MQELGAAQGSAAGMRGGAGSVRVAGSSPPPNPPERDHCTTARRHVLHASLDAARELALAEPPRVQAEQPPRLRRRRQAERGAHGGIHRLEGKPDRGHRSVEKGVAQQRLPHDHRMAIGPAAALRMAIMARTAEPASRPASSSTRSITGAR